MNHFQSKVFVNDIVTSVVIPVNEDYYEIKHGAKPKKNVWIENETKDIKRKILDSEYSKTIKQNILKVYEEVGTEVFDIPVWSKLWGVQK